MRLPVYILLFITLFSNCKSKEKISATATPVSADTVLLASIERTPCFGRCPTYKTTIYQNGYVKYEGKQNVINIGIFTTQLNQQTIDELKKYITENNIYELPDKNVNPHIADFPGTFTEINLNGKYKRIINTDPEAPKQLIEFEKFLDSLFNEKTNWQLLRSSNNE
ncbi:MAG: DUF6438 domain-containing protein [Bacteroidia bacterium]